MSGVFVTGMGLVSTAGHSIYEFWKTLSEGIVTYKQIDEYKDNPNFRIKIGARIEDSTWSNRVAEEYQIKYGRASNYAISAASAALEDAGLTCRDLPFGRTAVCIGTTMGEIQVEEEITKICCDSEHNTVGRQLLGKYHTHQISSSVREAIKSSGPVYVVPTACAAGNYAIALGMQLIQSGIADVAIVGGVDVFSRVAFTGFQRLLSLTPDLCRPFDRCRKGLVVGEGAGIVVLENVNHAKARSARVRGEVLSVGLTSDRYHMTSPHPEGDGAVRAMNKALKDAGILPGDIDYVSAHGTGTPANDRIESKALKKVLGDHFKQPVSSIKSMLGHAMGAASALELIASLLMMECNTMLPTVNYADADPECDIDCVPNFARKGKVECVLSNSFAFGGQSSSLIARKGRG